MGEWMMDDYIIKCGDKYLVFDRQHKISYTSSIDKAEKFIYARAKQLIDNNISPKERKKYQIIFVEKKERPKKCDIIEINNADTTSDSPSNDSQYIETNESELKKIKQITTKDSYKGECVYKPSKYDDKNINWYEKIEGFRTELEELKQYKINLQIQHREIEGKKEDIEHKLEFSNINAYSGYILAKMLKDVRIERRRIKDEMFIISNIISVMENSKLEDVWSGQLSSTIKGLDGRHYTPRVMPWLFDENADWVMTAKENLKSNLKKQA